jgi:O-antigen ligase
MEELRHGGENGIIDIVNTYIGIALGYGLVGLTPFVGMFIICLWKLWSLRRRLPKGSEGWNLSTAMIGVFCGVMLMIFSTSSISYIAYIYYSLIGLTVSIERVYTQYTPTTPMKQRLT